MTETDKLLLLKKLKSIQDDIKSYSGSLHGKVQMHAAILINLLNMLHSHCQEIRVAIELDPNDVHNRTVMEFALLLENISLLKDQYIDLKKTGSIHTSFHSYSSLIEETKNTLEQCNNLILPQFGEYN